MSRPTQIQIFGHRCSGTNYLEQLLQANLSCIDIKWDYGWKHFFHKGPIEQGDNCLFIVIYRNPFDWLRSLHRKPHHAARELKRASFSQFIRREWRCLYDEKAGISPNHPLYNTEMLHERDPQTGSRFANVIRMRSAKIRDWESLREKAKNTAYITYEELLDNPQRFIAEISEKFHVPRAAVFKPINDHKGKLGQTFRPKTYAAISASDLDHIVRELDADLELRAGYDIAALAEQHGWRIAKRGVGQMLLKLLDWSVHRAPRIRRTDEAHRLQ